MSGNGDSFPEFMHNIMTNPGNEEAKGWCFIFFAFPVFILCGLYGLSFFPAGRYPTILLLLPGFVISGILLTVIGFVVYKLWSWLAVPATLLGGVVAYLICWSVAQAVFHL